MKVVACLPGKSYSGNFLSCWTEFLGEMIKNNISVFLSQKYSPNIYYSRNLCLGGDSRKGFSQVPFNGDYDYLLWIDSDNLPKYEHFKKLLSWNVDICSGIYKMSDGRFATVKKWDTTYLLDHGEMKFCEEEDLCGSELIEVSYTGMGFMLVKAGVMEKIGYPWFKPLNINIGAVNDFTTEDVSFCLAAQSFGFKVLVDPTVRINHEKIFYI